MADDASKKLGIAAALTVLIKAQGVKETERQLAARQNEADDKLSLLAR